MKLLSSLLVALTMLVAQQGKSICDTDFQYTLGGCPNVSFFDLSIAVPVPNIAWNWDFGDGTTSAMQNPTHTYTANGTYIVCLTTITADFCTDVHCDTIVINCMQQPACGAGFDSFGSVCPSYTFNDTSWATGTIINWFWDFGDGTTSTLQNPAHTYAANGSYLACLTITTSDNCTSTRCDTIVVNCIGQPTCTPFFQYTLGLCPDVLFFDGTTASGNIVSWNWNFGDGGASTMQNPQHTYTANGNYLVCLTITTDDSCSSTYCDTIPINCLQQSTCNAGFQYTLGQCPDIWFFDGSTSSQYPIVEWDWSFGDGGTSTAQNPTHTYAANGNYLVCLTITTSDSCVSSYCDTIPINCIQTPGCGAGFNTWNSVCPNYTFTDTSWATGTITNWFWDFGDGTTSTLQNPTHTYTSNGSYLACLTIYTSDSCTSTQCDTVVVNCIGQSNCSAFYQYTIGACPAITFFDLTTATGNVIAWNWDFGDGGASAMQNPTHTYTANGNYLVCLTVFTDDSCSSTYCDTLSINCIQQSTCNAGFQYTLGQCPDIWFFDGSTSSQYPIVEWDWSFGDGGTSTAQNPTHTYTANGNYLVCLTITTADSCVSSYCDTIPINCIQTPACGAGFNTWNSVCPNYTFTDTSWATGTITNWFWDFGDGTTSTLQNPTHTYTANGSYLACLTIYTSDSCTSTQCDTVVVNCIGQSNCSAFYQYTIGACPAITFFDLTTATGNVIAWNWDFGDGGASAMQNPTHTYTANGNYLVCLTVFTDDSCSSTYCDTLSINCIQQSTCNAGFQYTLGQCPDIWFFDGSTSSQYPIVEWDWSFGDGGTSTAQNPTHTYTANGNYLVCLTITTADSCVSTYCDTVPINCIGQSNCQSAFNINTAQEPSIAFTDVSTSSPYPIVEWNWSFGDGGTSTAQNPTHTYTANGSYLVCLTITTSDSCVSTSCDTVVITSLGINDWWSAQAAQVYPNPANHIINVQFAQPLAQKAELTLLDITGKVVEQKVLAASTTLEQVNVSHLAKGMYMLKLSNGKQQVVRRLIISR